MLLLFGLSFLALTSVRTILAMSQWWTDSTLQEFKAKTQCFVDQYGGFTVEDPQGHENQVNGKLTLGENLADNGG